MQPDTRSIPFAQACLVLKFLHNRITNAERNELDDWICASNENMALFEDLTKGVDDTVFDPDDLIAETEQVIDLWIIASLIARRQKELNNEAEEQYLDEWIQADSQNKMLYEKLQHPAYMQKMLVWNELKRQELKVS